VTQLLERFKAHYSDLKQMDLSQSGRLYSNAVIFKDPVHEIRGLVALEDYMAHLCENITEGRFEYLDQLASDNTAYIKWIMHLRHPKLGTQPIAVRGISQIQFDSHIYFQEDCYDMGAMLYDNLPILGHTTKWLKQRLASQA